MRGNIKHLVFCVCVAFVLCAFASVVSARTIYVPDDYEKIQWAIDNASAGDNIIVRDRTYYENLKVDKQLTIKSENGSDNCIVDGGGNGDVITLNADGITIEGFTVRNSGSLLAGIKVFSNANKIAYNSITNNCYGIYLEYSSNNTIYNNTLSSNNRYGILLSYSNNNTIANNNASNNGDGIHLWYSNRNIIANNTVSNNNWYGISLWYSSSNIIANNIASSNFWDGIYLYSSSRSTIANNTASNNRNGIYLYSSSRNIIANNTASNNGDGIYLDNSSRNIIANNNASNNWDGIELWHSNRNTIANNNVSNNWDGIYLDDSSNNTLANNNMTDNTYNFILIGWQDSHFDNNIDTTNTVDGKPIYYIKNVSNSVYDSSTNAGVFYCIWCENVTVKDLNLTKNGYGVFFWKTNNSRIENINASNNLDGIYLRYSSRNIIANNNASNNYWYGISLRSSSNNILVNNTVSNNYCGIYLAFSSNNIIANNTALNNDDGIVLYDSSNNIIANNTISNNYRGISFHYFSNIIYLNNFIDNAYQVCSYKSTNIWNSTEKITYTYNGKQFTNYLGNYWSDYKGSDADEDGIGDTPYIIDGDKDEYPLIEQFENYFVPTLAQIFDTGRPENPYPSISGKFIGTIKTNKKVIATKLYTYACEGTGGHTEYALICNKTWCAEASWKGYEYDWMNIYFNRTVVLMPYETYNITIVTGSYPQIHHTHSLKTENGWINCTEFTDANGNKYENWIPAIKLWS